MEKKSEATHVSVSIPVEWLILLACQGSMGTGETPIRLQNWADGECKKNGLGDRLSEARREYVTQLKQRVVQLMGSEMPEDFSELWTTCEELENV